MELMDNLEFENKLSKDFKIIAGMDEVGRGPLAGPVTVAICAMPLNDIILGVTDSKKISKKKRETLCQLIREKAIFFDIIDIDESVIDEINILNATKKAMMDLVHRNINKFDYLLVDAVDLKIGNSLAIIKGDLKSYSIACASILAKVHRDNYMDKMHVVYPAYDFISNKGYGTKKHIDAIKKYGICKIHRRSFVKNFIEE